jgi:hypothetical protein
MKTEAILKEIVKDMKSIVNIAGSLLVESLPVTATCDLLIILDEEWNKFCDSNPETMEAIVDELVKREVYSITPIMKEKGWTALQMVENYGANWHIYAKPLTCPYCKTDLRDPMGPPFKREIGQYDQAKDRTICFLCPNCQNIVKS